jgi:glycosyltransferase involved in cell wall biosynthesis
MRATRIAVINSHPIQYFAPLYRFLNAAPDLDVTAIYLSDVSIRGGNDTGFGRDVKWDLDLLEGYRSVFIGSAHSRVPRGFWSLIAPSICEEVRSGRYDVLWLHGHNYAANIMALMAAKLAGMPVMMRGDTHLGLPRGDIKAALRQPVMGALYSLCDRLLAIGSANAAFYRAMGAPDHKVFMVPLCVDNDRFMSAANLNTDQRAEVRRRYGVPLDRPLVLYAAKFITQKRPDHLLEAVRRLNAASTKPFTLLMAGSGELEPKLHAICVAGSLNNVIFSGFINQSQLPGLYAASDIFVLPSEQEPWGLAVNEAMCAGLPIVISREAGCVADLVQDGINGFTPAADDIDGFAKSLQRLIEDEELRRRQGRASLELISGWGYQQCLDGIRSALMGLDYKGLASKPVFKTSHG